MFKFLKKQKRIEKLNKEIRIADKVIEWLKHSNYNSSSKKECMKIQIFREKMNERIQANTEELFRLQNNAIIKLINK